MMRLHTPDEYGYDKKYHGRKRLLLIVMACLVLAAITAVLIFALKPGAHLTQSPSQQPRGNAIKNPIKGQRLYVDPNSHAAQTAVAWSITKPADASYMYKLADQPSARWFATAVTYADVHGYVQAANDASMLPVTVAYYLPQRDCNKYSAGGAADEAGYKQYIDTYAQAISSLKAVVVLEPDAIIHMQTCLDAGKRALYTRLLSYAVDRFTALPTATVYIDAGNSGWVQNTGTTAKLLKSVGVSKTAGFSLNVSNFQTTAQTTAYGDALSRAVGGKHYIIDTSRNGLGPYDNTAHPDYNWCNPPGRALGHYPTTTPGVDRVDAYLYIKNIGESDGADPDVTKCFGGPAAGTWWPEYALDLVKRWPANLQYNPHP